MPTKRVPINRPAKVQISDEMVDLFDRMQTLECTCEEVNQHIPEAEYWKRRLCPGCEEYLDLEFRIIELWPGCRPWWRLSPPDLDRRTNKENVARWRQLEAASAARKASTRS